LEVQPSDTRPTLPAVITANRVIQRVFILISRQSDLYEMCRRLPTTKKLTAARRVSVSNKQMRCLGGTRRAPTGQKVVRCKLNWKSLEGKATDGVWTTLRCRAYSKHCYHTRILEISELCTNITAYYTLCLTDIWLATDWATGVRSPTEVEDFPSTLCVQPVLDPSQLPVQWVPGIFPWGKRGRGVLLNIHPLLVPWVKKERGCTSSPAVCKNRCVRGNLYLFYRYLQFVFNTDIFSRVKK
jgi:hypothetical protein